MFRKLGVKTVLTNCLLFSAIITLSCTNTKQVTYFYGAPEGDMVSNTPIPESLIQKNDILGITISSRDPNAAAFLNPYGAISGGGSTGAEGGGASSASGYLVSSDGFIQVPLIGNIKAEGLTKYQLKDRLLDSITRKKLLVDPVVTIRFQNFRVTVLGEVNRPSVISIPNEKVSLLEAIGLAGDLTLYGKRDNVMIIRETKDQRHIERINLNSTELFTSPYYYLQSNDIVYVEPNKAKVASTKNTQWVGILLSGLSLAAVVANIAITSNK